MLIMESNWRIRGGGFKWKICLTQDVVILFPIFFESNIALGFNTDIISRLDKEEYL